MITNTISIEKAKKNIIFSFTFPKEILFLIIFSKVQLNIILYNKIIEEEAKRQDLNRHWDSL